MPSQNIVNIIIKAEDKISSVTSKVSSKLKQMGNEGAKASELTSQSNEKLQQQLESTNKRIANASRNFNKIGRDGSKSFQELTTSQQDSVIKFNMLDKSSQNLLQRISNIERHGLSGFGGAINDAKNKFVELDSYTQTWSGKLAYAKSKLQLLGTDTDSLKGKVQVAGSAIQMHLAQKWDTVKTKVSEVAGTIKSKISSAINTAGGYVRSLADKFSGLGGVISGIFGGIGLKGIYDMTIGMATSREQVHTLMQSVMGAGTEFENFWNEMDTTTNGSLVSLDELSQAMSVIKMSTGASTSEMSKMMPLVNDIGQRAILMGRTGDEAIGMMQAAGKGLNGEFEMLKDNFGVTKDKLQELGWSGEADDVEGYIKALDEFMDRGGDLEGMMGTTEGKMTVLQKRFRVAGREIGEEFKPYLDDALDTLLKWTEAIDNNGDGKNDNMLMKYAIGAMSLASGFATLAPTLAPIIQTLDGVWKGTKGAYDGLKKIKEKFENLRGEEGTIQKIKDKFNSLKDKIGSAKTKLSEFYENLKKNIGGKIDSLKTKFNSLKDTISNAKTKLSEFYKRLKENVSGKIDLLKTKFSQLKDKISNVKDKVIEFASRLKTIAVNKIDSLKLKFGELKDKILLAKGKLIEFIGRLKAIAVAKITALKDAFVNLASGINLATIKEKLYAVWQGIVNGLTAIWNALLAMNPLMWVVIAIGAFIAIMIYLYNTNETVRNAINGLWEMLQGFGSWISSVLVSAWNNLIVALQPVIEFFVTVLTPAILGIFALFTGDTEGALSLFGQAWTNLMVILQPVSEFLSSVFGPAWDLIMTVLTNVWNTLFSIINAFQLFANGQMSLPELIMTIWSLISNLYMTIFTTIINFVRNFAQTILGKAIEAGSGFYNNIRNYVSQLPSMIYNYLMNVVANITMAGISWAMNARNRAYEMVNAVTSQVQQLPERVGQEFWNIGSRMMQAGSDLINKAQNIGQNIVKGLLGAMGIHSPGDIQEGVVTEFTDMIDRVKEKAKSAKESAIEVGKNMVDGFQSQNVEDALDVAPNLSNMDTDPLVGNHLEPTAQQEMPTMTANITPEYDDSKNQEITEGYTVMGNSITTVFTNMNEKVKSTLENMTNSNNTAYDTIANKEQSSMNQISNHVQTSMNKILVTTQNGLRRTTNTTNTNLKNMQSSTSKTTKNMTNAWGTMKDSIIASADQIRRDSTNHFDTLSGTIGGFYRRLQNPGGWGAGAGTGRPSTIKKVGHKSGGLKKITNAMKQAKTPQYLTLGQVKRNPLINSSVFGEYITTRKHNKFSVSDLIRAGTLRIPIGFEDIRNKGAGWFETAYPNVEHIKSTVRPWTMKGPKIIGKYQTSKVFKVGDFEGGEPNIGFGDFKQMAEDVFSQCHYEFYYDSNKYGNWMTAFRGGGMNCSDSSDALIAMAHACGLSAHKVHGHWNQFGHFWADVEGHKMDTTGWMQQRNWTPSASHAGPAPRDNTLGDIIDTLKDLFEPNPSHNSSSLSESYDSEFMELGGTVTIIHQFEGLPDTVNAEEVARLVNNATNDENWIKNLVKNVRFQKFDLEMKDKIVRKDNRARGV